jgi:hypothetical protein
MVALVDATQTGLFAGEGVMLVVDVTDGASAVVTSGLGVGEVDTPQEIKVAESMNKTHTPIAFVINYDV